MWENDQRISIKNGPPGTVYINGNMQILHVSDAKHEVEWTAGTLSALSFLWGKFLKSRKNRPLVRDLSVIFYISILDAQFIELKSVIISIRGALPMGKYVYGPHTAAQLWRIVRLKIHMNRRWAILSQSAVLCAIKWWCSVAVSQHESLRLRLVSRRTLAAFAAWWVLQYNADRRYMIN